MTGKPFTPSRPISATGSAEAAAVARIAKLDIIEQHLLTVEDVVVRLAQMGVDRPRPLVHAVLNWGTVDIREDGDQRRLRGGE